MGVQSLAEINASGELQNGANALCHASIMRRSQQHFPPNVGEEDFLLR